MPESKEEMYRKAEAQMRRIEQLMENEHPHDSVSYQDRFMQLVCTVDLQYVEDTRELLAQLVENAYLAGVKRINCTGKSASHQYISDEQLAQLYVKDKGLRL